MALSVGFGLHWFLAIRLVPCNVLNLCSLSISGVF